MRLSRLLPAAAVLALVGCDGSDPAPRSCALYDTCDIEQPLRLTPLNVQAEPPANVEVLFQVQTATREPISGLALEAFSIFEDGEPISRFEASATIQPRSEQFRSATVLLLDFSRSIVDSGNLPVLQDAAASFVRELLPPTSDPDYGEAEVAVYGFDGSETIGLIVPFSFNADEVVLAIENASADDFIDGSSTNLNGAVVAGIGVVQDEVDRLAGDVRIAVGSLVTFTDGTDTAGRVSLSRATSAVSTASSEQVRGVNVFNAFTIGLGGEVDETALEQLGPALSVQANNTAELEARFREIAARVEAEANSFYVLEYCSPKRAGTHTLGIRVAARGSAGFLEERFDASRFTTGCRVD